MRNLVIDIGNTYSKLAVFEAKEMVYFQRYELVSESILAQIIDQYQIQNATISTVRQDIDHLADFLKGKINYIPFSTSVNLGVKNNYQTPATLGLDRWAKVIAAFQCRYLYHLRFA
jgi:type III pantothenate kinase